MKKNQLSKLTTILIVTINCKLSLKTIKNLSTYYKIIIVENNNCKKLKNFFINKFDNIEFIVSKKNLGFGGGNNIGLNKIKTPNVLILNPDVGISKKNVKVFEKYSKQILDYSILTANIKDFDLTTNSNLDRIDKNSKFKINDLKVQQIPWVPEWCMYCKISDLKKINYFDENYFLYFEGLDLCKELTKLNKKFYLIKDNMITHEFGGTSKNLNKSEHLTHWKLRYWHFYWSSFYYHRKHYGYVASFYIHISKLFRFFFKKNYYYFFRKNDYEYITTKAKFEGILSQIFNKKSYFRVKL